MEGRMELRKEGKIKNWLVLFEEVRGKFIIAYKGNRCGSDLMRERFCLPELRNKYFHPILI